LFAGGILNGDIPRIGNAVDKICQAFSFSALSLKWIQTPGNSRFFPDVAGVRLMSSNLGNWLAIGDGK
jgi:hypothetical protein